VLFFKGSAVKFQKPPLSIPQQIHKWKSRGLDASDATRAEHYLAFIGYYRFSGYAYPFQDLTHPDKHFRAGTTFEQILSVYIFDRELRLLVMDSIERIEVAVRTCIVNEMSLKYGPHWFMDASLFHPKFRHNDFLDMIDGELGIAAGAKRPFSPHNEAFINHYYAKYTDPYLPPAWMVLEILSIGRLSKMFASIKAVADRAAVAQRFAVDEQILAQWLHCLSYVRNLCAHHCRLWNRKLVIKAAIAKKHSHLSSRTDQFYAVAIILNYMLPIIAPGATWHNRLKSLIDSSPDVPIAWAGFPANWKAEPFWA
jgi:abortive infection bacteriophage resistance protein